MPAVHLNRLEAEIRYLVKQFDEPERFIPTLTELFERYASWSFRPGKLVHDNIQIPQYHLPDIVMQKLSQALRPYCRENLPATRRLAALLWKGEYYEHRLFAILLLSMLPLEDPNIFMEKMQEWIHSESETRLHADLFSTGCRELRAAYPALWLEYTENWTTSEDVKEQALGLQALTASLNDPGFKHVPNLFRLSTDLMRTAPLPLLTFLQELLEAMLKRSPSETIFFLQQLLVRGASDNSARLIRRQLPRLPRETQVTLRTLLNDRQKKDVDAP